MSPKEKVIIIIASLTLMIIILLIIWRDAFLDWLQSQWSEIIIAAILAIIAGLFIEVAYRKYSPKSKFSQTTVYMEPQKLLAKLILPDKNFLTISDKQQTFGRDDFLGSVVSDQLLFIGKEHFKISRREDGFYIEDLNTKNGTIVNGEEIKGQGKIRLVNESQIVISQIFTVTYVEENADF
jgi:pSer/pThr/pTyr-binding forkhead associated (FHA) protein